MNCYWAYLESVCTLSLDRHFRLWVNLLAFYHFLRLVSRNSGKGSLTSGLALGPKMPEQRYGKRAVNDLRAMGTYKKNKKIVTNYACFCQTTMLTPKMIKETTENFFQFDLDNDKSWNYLWYCYVRAPVHPLLPLLKRQGGSALVMHPHTGNPAGASH